MTKKNFPFLALVLAVFLVALDQFTKYLAFTQLSGQEPFVIIDGVFELHYLRNMGAAFGIFQNKQVFFIVITLIVMLFIAYVTYKLPYKGRYTALRLTLILLFSGALGNFIDRFTHNYVTDFFYFKLIDFPIFNVADIYVVVSVFLLAFLLLFVLKEEDMDEITQSLKGGFVKKS